MMMILMMIMIIRMIAILLLVLLLVLAFLVPGLLVQALQSRPFGLGSWVLKCRGLLTCRGLLNRRGLLHCRRLLNCRGLLKCRGLLNGRGLLNCRGLLNWPWPWPSVRIRNTENPLRYVESRGFLDSRFPGRLTRDSRVSGLPFVKTRFVHCKNFVKIISYFFQLRLKLEMRCLD